MLISCYLIDLIKDENLLRLNFLKIIINIDTQLTQQLIFNGHVLNTFE